MPPQRPEPLQRPFKEKLEESFNIVLWAVAIVSMCVLPLTRRRWGAKGLGAEGFWSFLFIPLYASYVADPIIVSYWYVWITFAVLRRLTATRREHRLFQGIPILWGRFLSYYKARFMEALTLWLAGPLLMPVSPALAFFVGVLCAGGVTIQLFLHKALDEAELAEIEDARKEAEFMHSRVQQAMRRKR